MDVGTLSIGLKLRRSDFSPSAVFQYDFFNVFDRRFLYSWLTHSFVFDLAQTMALLRFSVLPAALKNYGCGGLSVSLG